MRGRRGSSRGRGIQAPNRRVSWITSYWLCYESPLRIFRPDTDYVGGYTAETGRASRKRVALGIAATYKLRMLDSWSMPALGIDCVVMQAADDLPLEPIVAAVSRDARVEWAQAMQQFHLLAHNDPLFPSQPTATLWHLAEIHLIATGLNVKVAAIDSGVETDHPDLVGRIIEEKNFVDGGQIPPEAHGTAVAGIIGARADDALGRVGVSPRASLYALRACWQTSGGSAAAICSSFTLAKAIQFALDHDAKVINLSLSGPRDRLLADLLDFAASRGVVIVAATDPNERDGGFPASAPGVVAVAMDGDESTVGTAYIAPGQGIPATLPGRRWGFVNGSSFAAAEVTGLVALLLEIAPHQSPQQIREALGYSMVARTLPSSRRVVVDACAALAKSFRWMRVWLLRVGGVGLGGRSLASFPVPPLRCCSSIALKAPLANSPVRPASYPIIGTAA